MPALRFSHRNLVAHVSDEKSGAKADGQRQPLLFLFDGDRWFFNERSYVAHLDRNLLVFRIPLRPVVGESRRQYQVGAAAHIRCGGEHVTPGGENGAENRACDTGFDLVKCHDLKIVRSLCHFRRDLQGSQHRCMVGDIFSCNRKSRAVVWTDARFRQTKGDVDRVVEIQQFQRD